MLTVSGLIVEVFVKSFILLFFCTSARACSSTLLIGNDIGKAISVEAEERTKSQ